jgi:hypothetical protein
MNAPRKLAAILAADMVDFSGLMGLRRYAQAPRKLRRELHRSRIGWIQRRAAQIPCALN